MVIFAIGIIIIFVTLCAQGLSLIPFFSQYMSFFTSWHFLLYPLGAALIAHGAFGNIFITIGAFVGIALLYNAGAWL